MLLYLPLKINRTLLLLKQRNIYNLFFIINNTIYNIIKVNITYKVNNNFI